MKKSGADASKRMMLALLVLMTVANPGEGGRSAPQNEALSRRAPCEGLDVLGRRTVSLPFPVGEELGYRLTFAGAYVGKFETKVGEHRIVEGRRVLPIFGRARTNALVASFKPFKGRYMTMIEEAPFRPVALRTEVTYGEDPRWERVDFSEDRRRIDAEFRTMGRELERHYATDHAATDILALMFWARILEMNAGSVACQDVFSARRLWRMTGRVRPISTVRTAAGKRKAHRVDLHFVRKPTPGLRRRNPPSYDFTVYVSADEWQTPLKFVFMLDGVAAEGHLEHWSFKSTKRWSEEG